jgi:hypothetical protein
MLRELCPSLVDGYLPVRIRNLAYRLLLLRRPGEAALMREAAASLCLHGPDGDDIAADLERQADALDAVSQTLVPKAARRKARSDIVRTWPFLLPGDGWDRGL